MSIFEVVILTAVVAVLGLAFMGLAGFSPRRFMSKGTRYDVGGESRGSPDVGGGDGGGGGGE